MYTILIKIRANEECMKFFTVIIVIETSCAANKQQNDLKNKLFYNHWHNLTKYKVSCMRAYFANLKYTYNLTKKRNSKYLELEVFKCCHGFLQW